MKARKTKKQLQESSQHYQEALEADLDALLERSKRILTGALIVGIGFWVAYKLFKALSQDRDPKQKDHEKEIQDENNESPFRNVIKDIILKELALFLLGVLKDNVVAYLKSMEKNHDNS